jgi:hypothetical protein
MHPVYPTEDAKWVVSEEEQLIKFKYFNDQTVLPHY